MMTEPIMSRTLICVTPSGQKIPVKMEIGKPYSRGNGFRCPVVLEPLYDHLVDIGGADPWQAVQLAMHLVEQFLRDEVERGSTLHWPGEEGNLGGPYEFD